MENKTFLDHLLNEYSIEVDPNDPNKFITTKKAIVQAERNPTKASRQATMAARDRVKQAQVSDSSTKDLDVKIAKMQQQISQLQQRRQQIKARESTGATTPTIEGYEFLPGDTCEVVYVNENNEVVHVGPLNEASIRQFKRFGTKLKKQFRCITGPKKGRIVSSPTACSKRKDPKKVRQGRKTAKLKKGVRIHKTQMAKKKSISKLVTRLNRRLKGPG